MKLALDTARDETRGEAPGLAAAGGLRTCRKDSLTPLAEYGRQDASTRFMIALIGGNGVRWYSRSCARPCSALKPLLSLPGDDRKLPAFRVEG